MAKDLFPQKKLTLCTALLLLVLMITTPHILKARLPDPVSLSIKDQPTLGFAKAPLHIVVFEEPKCSNCKRFNHEVFPQIKTAYIDTGKATYTVIPVSFLPGSMTAAIALLCVYHSDPLYPNSELYFSYLDYLYEHQPGESVDWATTSTLLTYAEQTSPAISKTALEQCVTKQAFRQTVERNTAYGKQVMKGELATPTLYINGIEAPELDFEAIKSLIEEIEQSGAT